MFGNNPKRPFIQGDGNIIAIQNIFKTIQGEGPFAGIPAIFIRLGGCNLACNFCDTEFENFTNISTDDILDQVLKLSNDPYGTQIIRLVVITGGEPLRQPIERLCEKLINLNLLVQVETNGTLYRKLHKSVHIVCSPKTNTSGYNIINQDLLQCVDTIKFLIAKNIPYYRDVPDVGQNKYNIPVFIQPIDQCDEKLNRDNIKLTVEIALNKGYKISLQLHKILSID